MITISRRAGIVGGAAAMATPMLPTRLASAISARAYCPSAKERSVFKRLNAYRTKNGRGKLKLDRSLGAAARHHAADMAKRDYFDHRSPNGDDASGRARQHGYKGRSVGENIAQGYQSPTAVMKGWQRSAGHRRNMLSGRYDAVGIGYDAKGGYWVQVLGDELFAEPACRK